MVPPEVFLENPSDILAGIHAELFTGNSTRTPLGISEFAFTILSGIPDVFPPQILPGFLIEIYLENKSMGSYLSRNYSSNLSRIFSGNSF